MQKIADAGYDKVYGARPLKRAIQHQIENPLSKLILSGRFGAQETIALGVEGGVLVFGKSNLELPAEVTRLTAKSPTSLPGFLVCSMADLDASL